MKGRILWVSFRQKHLSCYEEYFHTNNQFFHKMINVKNRNPLYFIGYAFAFIYFFTKNYDEKFIDGIISQVHDLGKNEVRKESEFSLKLKAIFWQKWAEKLIKKEDPTAIILWGGLRVYQIALERCAIKNNIKVFFLENGFFPNTTQLEEFGNNWRSTMKYLGPKDYMELKVEKQKVEQLYDLPILPRERRKVSGIQKRKLKEKKISNLPDKYVFLPFQVSKDSQIRLYSPWIKNMPTLVEVVFEAVTVYNQKFNANLSIVLKEHPSDFGRANYMKEKKKWKPQGIIIANSIETSELIEKSQAVITINSSVGAESLLRKKPVIVLGKAVYSQPGVTQEAENIEQIINALEHLGDAYDNNTRDHLIYYFCNKRLVKGHWRNLTEEHWEAIEKRIKYLLSHKVKSEENSDD